MKKFDLLWWILVCTAVAVAILNIAFVIFLSVNIKAVYDGIRFTISSLKTFSIIVTVFNLAIIAFATTYFFLRQKN